MKPLALTSMILMLATSATANEFRPAMESYLNAEIVTWLSDPVLIQAVKDQNARTQKYGQGEIDELDRTWRAEVGNDDSQMIAGVLESTAADFLRERLDSAGGMITEIFAMDARGLNVAASSVTSDYWQGDEAKFQQTFPQGADAVHFGDVEFDESSQTYQAQVSTVIVDPESNTPIGAITIGLNADAFF